MPETRELNVTHRDPPSAANVSESERLVRTIQRFLDIAEAKSKRTVLPKALNRFPINRLGFLSRRILGFYEYLFRDQREANYAMMNAILELAREVDGSLAQKADRSELEAVASGLDQKADRSELEAVASGLDQKADRSALDAVASGLDQKADRSALEAVASGHDRKADRSELEAVASGLDQKADRSELEAVASGLDQKADRSELEAVASGLDQKADRSELDAVASGLDQKADRSELEAVASGLDQKADRSALDAVASGHDRKADRSELEAVASGLDQKADRSELEAVASGLDQKADISEVRNLTHQTADNRYHILEQDRRLVLLLEEARKCLPDSMDSSRVQALVNEKDHVSDAMYVSFEDRFRGTREDIKERQRVYLPYLAKSRADKKIKKLVDLGCGRGEWLELLKEKGYSAIGIDVNRVMIELCKERHLDVLEADVIEFFSRQKNNTFSVITSFHLIEHLGPERLKCLLDESRRVLRPGGLIILESPNPENLVVGACHFYADPTHRNPLPPTTTAFLLEARGFVKIEILRLHPMNEGCRITEDGNAVATEFNRLFCGPQDYAVIARKA